MTTPAAVFALTNSRLVAITAGSAGTTKAADCARLCGRRNQSSRNSSAVSRLCFGLRNSLSMRARIIWCAVCASDSREKMLLALSPTRKIVPELLGAARAPVVSAALDALATLSAGSADAAFGALAADAATSAPRFALAPFVDEAALPAAFAVASGAAELSRELS